MSGPEYLLAILLLTGAPGTPETPPETEKDFAVLSAAVHKLSIEWEILDPRETGYIFAKPAEFDTDLNLLRRRHRELKDAPRLDECNRLPDRRQVNDLVQFNRAYRKHLVDRHTLEQDRSDKFEAAMLETDRLYRIWDAVRDARCEFYYVTERRRALVKLKGLIGEQEYHAVNLPPNVPTWRFHEGE